MSKWYEVTILKTSTVVVEVDDSFDGKTAEAHAMEMAIEEQPTAEATDCRLLITEAQIAQARSMCDTVVVV